MLQQHRECEREKDSLLLPLFSSEHLPTLPERAVRPGLGPGSSLSLCLSRRMLPTDKTRLWLPQMPWEGPGILLRFTI